MEDRAFLIWLHQRLEHQYGESSLCDFMHKLRAIIKSTPAGKITANIATHNSLESLIEELDYERE